MTSQEIREKFIQFFKEKKHQEMPPSPLVPDTVDPSVLFTTAGMQQFKGWFSGEEKPKYPRVVTIQPCLRTSDIDVVGDKTHLTFFEMLGNFSFGYPKMKDSYFKKKAIKDAWEFLTEDKWLGLEKSRITATYFIGNKKRGLEGDNDSLKILESLQEKGGLKNIGARVYKENFWSLGTEGSPGGPTVEFYFDNMEVWNLVFNEFKLENGKWVELAQKGVDTGMGLERITAVVQGKDDIFETDLFDYLLKNLEELRVADQIDRKIIADHIKAATFLLANGVYPDNEGRGSVVKSLFRESFAKIDILLSYAGKRISLDIPAEKIIDYYKDTYPILESQKVTILKNIKGLENAYSLSTRNAKWEFDNRARYNKQLLDLINDYEKNKNLGVVRELIFKNLEKTLLGVSEELMNKFKKGLSDGNFESINKLLRKLSTREIFYFYETKGLRDFRLIKSWAKEKGLKYSYNKTIFEELFKKHQEISRRGMKSKFNSQDQDNLARLHTATHILHETLRRVLGKHVEQRGQDINSERIRFDFSHPEKLTPEQLKEIEDKVNEIIEQKLPVNCEETSVEEAKKQGARAQFLDKYAGKVTMYSVGPSTSSGQAYSKELCKGPHVKNTSELGRFKIIKEEASSAGVRRIKATLK